MSNYKIKNLPLIALLDLLKKRRETLKNFLSKSGIVSYTTLLKKCKSMGVAPPSEEVFEAARGKNISSPQEGIVVLDPPSLIKEDTGQKIDVDQFAVNLPVSEETETEKALDEELNLQETEEQQLNSENSDTTTGVNDDVELAQKTFTRKRFSKKKNASSL